MAVVISVEEKFGSPKESLSVGSGSTTNKTFIIVLVGAELETEDAKYTAARDELISEAPTTVTLPIIGAVAPDPLTMTVPAQFYDVEDIGNYMYVGIVRYFFSSKPVATGDSTFQFDTGGGSQKITQSISTEGRFAVGTAPDFKGAIGVTDKNVAGVDIVVPAYTWSETHYKRDNQITQAYKDILWNLTGSVNNATFQTKAAGEVLFLGASGSKRGSENWELTFKFSAQVNVTGLQIHDITGIAKKGWEYLWIRYEDIEDATAKKLVKRPVAVIVEKVYELKDFSDLDL